MCKRKPCMIGFQVELMKWISWIRMPLHFIKFSHCHPRKKGHADVYLEGGTSSIHPYTNRKIRRNTFRSPLLPSLTSPRTPFIKPSMPRNIRNTMGVRYEIQFNLENSITEPSRVLFVSHRAMLQIKMDDFCGAFHGVTNTFGYVFRQLLLDTAD